MKGTTIPMTVILNLSEVAVGACSSLASSFNTIDWTPQLKDCDSPWVRFLE